MTPDLCPGCCKARQMRWTGLCKECWTLRRQERHGKEDTPELRAGRESQRRRRERQRVGA